MDEMTLTLNNPLTEEEWDLIEDVDFDKTNSIEFHTKHGKTVKFVKCTDERSSDLISRQEAIDILYDFAGCIVDTPNGHYHKAYLAYRHRMEILPSAQPEPKWIPCSERMPEEGSWAIWCSNKGSIQVARWKIDAWDHFYPDQGFFELEDAVAWMQLPQPYMGGEQE